MFDIARLDPREREILFRNTAMSKGLPESIIEKDFWVCFVLDYLFHKSKWQKQLAFKGGTSLSKAYDLIQRFSEDIDLMLDWRVLGYGKNEPWEQRSKTKQLEFNKDLLVSLVKYRNLLYFYRNEDFRKTLMNSMAHDLKTPLAAMSGYAHNLKENVGTDKREHYAQAIEDNANYMNGIITDILALSKIEENMLHPKKQSTDFVEVLNEIAGNYKDQLEEKKLHFTCKGIFIRRVDPTLIKRALENLFTNAMKYTEEGGEIKISAKHIPFNEQLIFENSPAKTIECKPKKLWEPFVKGSESRTENNGTGVGLAITKNILDMHHLKGKISYKDNLFIVRIK